MPAPSAKEAPSWLFSIYGDIYSQRICFLSGRMAKEGMFFVRHVLATLGLCGLAEASSRGYKRLVEKGSGSDDQAFRLKICVIWIRRLG